MFGRNRFGTTRFGATTAVSVQYKELSGSVSVSSALDRDMARAIASTIGSSGSMSRDMTRTIAGTVGTSGAIARVLTQIKALAGTVATTAAMVRDMFRAIAGTSGTSGSVGRDMTRGVSATVGASGSAQRDIFKTLSDSVGTTGTIAKVEIFIKSLAGTVATTSAMVRDMFRAIAGTSGTSGSVGRDMTRGVSATVGASGSMRRDMARSLTTTVGTLGARAYRHIKSIATATVSTVGSAARSILKPLSDSVWTTGALGPRDITRPLSTTVGTSGGIVRSVTKALTSGAVAVVGACGRIVGPLLGGGVSVAAACHRHVIKPLVASAISAVGALSTTVYEIEYMMNKTIRQIFAKVRITYTDPYFTAGVDTEADAVGRYTYTAQTVDNVRSEEYKWFSLHRNVLDGTYHPLPGDQEYSVGWWGTQLSDGVTGAFSVTYPFLTLTHSPRTIETLLVVGDDKLGEYPVDFEINLYDDEDNLLHNEVVTGNTLVSWTLDIADVDDVAKQTLEITKWSRVDAVSKIAQFYTMLEEVYYSEDGDIVSIDVTEQREFTGTTIPQGNLAASEIRIRLNNIDGTFDPGNLSSRLYGMILNNRAITAWLGVDMYPSGVRRWYPLGTFYSRDWDAPANEIWVEVTGQDMLSRLDSTTFSTSEVYEDKTLSELAVIVMTDAGLTAADWDIDAALDAITVPYAWFDQMTHREALRRIAAAALGQCYCNRDGQVVLEIYEAPTLNPFSYTESNVYTFDRPLQWSQMVNYVEAQAQPRVPSAETEIVTDVEEFTVPAGGTVTKTHFYISTPCIDVQEPNITGGADISVDSYTAYAWGITATYRNDGVGDETVTQIVVLGKTLDVSGGRVVVAEDTTSIASNGKQTLSEPISSEFWQTDARAQTVADDLLESYKNPRRDIVMRARGNIAQLLGDRVECTDSWATGDTAQFGIVGQDISYDGGLEIVVSAQQLPALYTKALAATVGTAGTIANEEVENKPLAATVGVTATIARNITRPLTGTVSTSGGIIYSPVQCMAIHTAQMSNQDLSYSTARTDSTADTFTADASFGYIGQYHGTYYNIRRFPVVFDTSRIPSGATITAASIFVNITGANTGTSFTIVAQDGQPTYPHNPPVAADYDQSLYSGTGSGATAPSVTGWLEIPFNATGLAWINQGVGAVTKLMLRSSRDIAGSAPSGSEQVSFDGFDSSNIPYLLVEYT